MNDSPGKFAPVSGARLRVSADNLISSIRGIVESIKEISAIEYERLDIELPTIDQTAIEFRCKEFIDRVSRFASYFSAFHAGYKTQETIIAKRSVEYSLGRPEGHISNLERLCTGSTEFLAAIGVTWMFWFRGDAERNLLSTKGEWIQKWEDSEWWIVRTIPKGRDLRGFYLWNLPCVYVNHRESLEAMIVPSFLSHITQECKVLDLRIDTQNPQNTPGNKSPKPEIDTQNTQIKDVLSEDKRTLTWGGKSYPLKTNASRLVEKLLEVYPRSLHQEYLKTNCEFNSDIRNIVRDGKLQEVVVRAVGEGGKTIPGMWRLSDPK
jgi:hypothetical protein